MFVRFYSASIFLSKHAVAMFHEFLFSLGDFGKICLLHPYTTAPLIFLVTDKFFQILLVGVALGKAPILTIFLVKQTELALVRPPPLLRGQNNMELK